MQRGCMRVLVRTIPFISGVLLREYKYQSRRPMAVCGKDRDLSCTERTRTTIRCWDICEQTSVRPTRLDSKVIQTPVKGIHRQSVKPPVSGHVRLRFFPAEVAIFRRQPRPTAVSITITSMLIARNVCIRGTSAASMLSAMLSLSKSRDFCPVHSLLESSRIVSGLCKVSA